MTRDEMKVLVSQLKKVFDIVRLVDVSMTTQFSINNMGEIVKEPYYCYSVWNKSRRCENCISAKAFAQKNKMTKFEFLENDVYYVVSMYIEVDEVAFMLEMVSKITDDTLFGAYDKDDFMESISDYSNKLYVDPLTGAYNRRYYEEQLSGLTNIYAVAMLDVDNFKTINDTYGHQAGDLALRFVVDTVFEHIDSTDAVIRYGGDEFFIVFRNLTEETFADRLDKIRETINKTSFQEDTVIDLSVSIGGVYCFKKTMDVIRKADEMLYKAKEKRNDVQIHYS